MPPTLRSQPGRPRASGRARPRGQFELSQDEHRAAEIGLRIGRTWPHVAHAYRGELHQVALYLTSAERRASLGWDERFMAKWIGIGLAVSLVEHTIAAARSQ